MANRRQANASRLTALKATLRRAKPDDTLTLDALAQLWGCTKPNFVKIRDGIVDFPVHAVGPKGALLYPARAAVKAMIAEETKEERAAVELAKRQQRLLGKPVGRGKAPPLVIPVEQLAKLSRLSAEIEQREREQGLYIPAADVARVIGNVFGQISGMLSTLETRIDPSGIMPAPQRDMLNRAGKDLLLKVNAELKDMLNGNASPRRRQSPGSRRSPGRAR